MLKKTITYTDYDGNSRTEDFYFHFTKAESMEMEMGITGGLSQMLEKIIAEQDSSKMIATFKDVIIKAYGVKSPDGKRFIKTQDVKDSFMQTEAYSNLFMELATNADAAAAFMNGVIPQNIIAAT